MQVIVALVLLLALLAYMRVFLPLASRLDQVPTFSRSVQRMWDVHLRCFEVLGTNFMGQQ